MPLRKMTTLGETSERLQFRMTEVSDSRLKIELGMSIPPATIGQVNKVYNIEDVQHSIINIVNKY